MVPGTFTISCTDGPARLGTLHTAHGCIQTPVFMPVGTQASVKSLSPQDLTGIGAQIILGNTYHLYLRPGHELVDQLGGLHAFSSWDRPILTDSGGYQVFSLSALRRLTPEGVEFRSHIDGSKHWFTPQRVMDIQAGLGSDIMMVLDECVSYDANWEYTRDSVQLTTAWAQDSLQGYPPGRGNQLVFGIVQGGFFPDLRTRSAEEITALPFSGFAVGGLSVGEPKEVMLDILAHTAPLLPADKPRYLMGVGTPLDLLDGVAQGIDMFDCVLPTRNARNGTLYTSQGKINIKRREYRADDSPLDPQCNCYTCTTFSRAYLRHLYTARELLAYRLNTLHNLAFYLNLMRRVREAISAGTFAQLHREIQQIFGESQNVKGV
ncbi:tRNA guanosine(34) transglycosylase Tgt [Desulfovermiculus halophilus]|uniref:tRNA guanosine(34) transglycosylase Tgt n=1 Tax=Desulfovermiculus halophilus TaxID=339722 RepID=UPI00054EC350|nr:tRNA guanosine(34) transglycosylase Tgt [Desulfovermiculus halophilus]